MAPTLYTCLRCDPPHTWASHLPNPPRWCPKCHSQRWQTPRRQAVAPPVTRKIYPFHDLEVGQTITMPWHWIKFGEVREDRLNASMRRAVRQEEVRYGKKFLVDATVWNMIVRRLK